MIVRVFECFETTTHTYYKLIKPSTVTRESVDAQYQCKSGAYVEKRGGGGAGNPVVAACCVWSCIIACSNPILMSAVHVYIGETVAGGG